MCAGSRYKQHQNGLTATTSSLWPVKERVVYPELPQYPDKSVSVCVGSSRSAGVRTTTIWLNGVNERESDVIFISSGRGQSVCVSVDWWRIIPWTRSGDSWINIKRLTSLFRETHHLLIDLFRRYTRISVGLYNTTARGHGLSVCLSVVRRPGTIVLQWWQARLRNSHIPLYSQDRRNYSSQSLLTCHYLVKLQPTNIKPYLRRVT